MSYIYKITNLCNGRMYIGQTTKELDERWKEHLHDCRKSRCRNRPLYMAMNKYGADNFKIESIEEVDNPDTLFEREIYWVDYYDTFRNGYNATHGGGGKSTLDYGTIYETYKQTGFNLHNTATLLGIDERHASKVVRALSGKEKLNNPFSGGKRINMFYPLGDYVRTFPSSREAARYLINEYGLNEKNEGGYSSHIIAACKGKRKMAHGFVWEYAN